MEEACEDPCSGSIEECCVGVFRVAKEGLPAGFQLDKRETIDPGLLIPFNFSQPLHN